MPGRSGVNDVQGGVSSNNRAAEILSSPAVASLLARIERSIRAAAVKCDRVCEEVKSNIASVWVEMNDDASPNLLPPKGGTLGGFGVDAADEALRHCFALRDEVDRRVHSAANAGCVRVDCRSLKRVLDIEAARLIHRCSTAVGRMISDGVRELTSILEAAFPLMLSSVPCSQDDEAKEGGA